MESKLWILLILLGALVLCFAGKVKRESEEEDDDEFMPVEVVAAYCTNAYSEIMEVRPSNLDVALPHGAIAGFPAGVGNDPENVRIDRTGWIVEVPEAGEPHPSITVTLQTPGEYAPMIQEIIAHANANVAIEVLKPGEVGFEPLRGGQHFESTVVFDPPIQASELRFTLGSTHMMKTTHYNLKLAIYACYPDRLKDEEESQEIDESV